MKNQISEKNPFYIPKERYLELKHFCRQYKSWGAQLFQAGQISPHSAHYIWYSRDYSKHADPVPEAAIKQLEIQDKIDMITNAAKEAGGDYWRYILITVTEGRGYISLTMNDGLKLSRDNYYILIRKFYWLLDKARN